ncbi:MAG TPA: DUF3311 domain-containing protein [Streptosporangiaceae bacterium]|jgi:hypothetical protein
MGEPEPPRTKPVSWIIATILILVSVGGTLWVPLYARTTPKLGDFPFFYWYQLIWVPVVAILSWICYLLVRRSGGTS